MTASPLEIAEQAARIDGAELLDEIAETLRRYVVMTREQDQAVALWCLHTHAIEAADVTPYLYATSPEKRCGKTLLLEIASCVAREPVSTANISPAALYRVVEARHPTLFIDEIDALYSGRASERTEELRSLLNSGFARGAVVYRCVGRERDQVKAFAVFGAKMLAGLRRALPDTVLDRSVIVELRRRSRDEHVERYRRRDAEPQLASLRERCGAWAAAHTDELRAARPELPQALHDRAADGWEPLLAIADAAGGEWPERARRAALILSGAESSEDDSKGVQLLRDIARVFDGYGDDRIASCELATRLDALEDSPWGTLDRRPFDARALAKLLQRYHIDPHSIRINGEPTKGYERQDFLDAWRRYTLRDGYNGYKPVESMDSVDSVTVTGGVVLPTQNAEKPHSHAVVPVVTDTGAQLGGADDDMTAEELFAYADKRIPAVGGKPPAQGELVL